MVSRRSPAPPGVMPNGERAPIASTGRPRFDPRVARLLLAALLTLSMAPTLAERAIYAWGANQTAAGATEGGRTPGRVTLPEGPQTVAISAGQGYALALRSDGRIYEWGHKIVQANSYRSQFMTMPVTVDLPSGVRAVATSAGLITRLAAGSDGRVYAWGSNYDGTLGTITVNVTEVPLSISLPDGVKAVAVSAGSRHCLALGSDGLVYAWGNGGAGQLGRPLKKLDFDPFPRGVSLGEGVRATAISAGGDDSLALGSDGKLYAWGRNDLGQIAAAPSSPVVFKPTVVPLPGNARVVSFVARDSSSLVVTSDGMLYDVGFHAGIQPAARTTAVGAKPGTVGAVPIPLPGGARALAVASGNLVLASDGAVYAWGDNSAGQLGTGDYVDHATPVRVKGLVQGAIAAVAGGPGFGLALAGDCTVYAWGGLLGNGTKHESPLPVPVLLPGALPLSVGRLHNLVLNGAGTVFAWGDNSSGQLGNGTPESSDKPVAVKLPDDTPAVAVAAGNAHSLALGIDGRVFAWGDNSSGQLGDGTPYQSLSPIVVPLPNGVKAAAIAAGFAHSLALGSDGLIYAWGRNSQGELGTGTHADTPTPTPISLKPGLDAVAISSRGYHSLALGYDGTVYAWGINLSRTGTPEQLRLPARIAAVAMADGYLHSLVIAADGMVYARGDTGSGQLGTDPKLLGGRPQYYGIWTPSAIPSDAHPISVAAGDDHSLALTSDGTIYAWGGNGSGQLGTNTTDKSWRPSPVWLPNGARATQIAAGSGTSMALVTTAPNAAPGNVTASPVSGPPGGPATVTVSVDRIALAGLTLTVQYDPSLILAVGDVAPVGLFTGLSLSANAGTPGIAYVALAADHNLQGPGQVISLKFHLPADAEVGTVYPIHVTAAQGNDQSGASFTLGTADTSVTVAASALPGDVNGDGVVDLKDATLALQAAVRLIDLTSDQVRAADVNCDGAVTPADVSLILRRLLGRITQFPVCR